MVSPSIPVPSVRPLAGAFELRLLRGVLIGIVVLVALLVALVGRPPAPDAAIQGPGSAAAAHTAPLTPAGR